MNIKLKRKADDAMSARLWLGVAMIVLIIMVAVYLIGAQFRPDGNDANDDGGSGLSEISGDTDANSDAAADGDTDDVNGGDDFPDDTDTQFDSESDDTSDTEAPAETECVHIWEEADCETAKTCLVCGATEGDALGHSWRQATCNTPTYCSACGAVSGGELEHVWTEADCVTAKTCSVCGETDGGALGHDFASATCTKARECSRCDATKGEPRGHDWKYSGCEKPMTCSDCGKTKGEAPGHSWDAATCTKAKRCTACGKTSGSALGHKWNDGVCSLCGDIDPDVAGADGVVSKTLYIDNAEASVKVIYIDGTPYVPVVAFSKAIDANSELKTSDNGSEASVKASGLGLSAEKGDPYIEANERCLPCEDVKVHGGKVYATLDVMTKVFGASVKYKDEGAYVSAKGGYIKSGDDYYDAETLSLLARLINCEAGYEKFDGKLAVGAVVMNRVSSSEFPNTIYDVIHQKNQFSVVGTGIFKNEPNKSSLRAAKMCLEGYRYDKRVLFFDSAGEDTWAADNRPFLYKLGGHYFYG